MRWYVGNYQGYKFGRIGFVLHLGLPVPAFGLFLLFLTFYCVCVLSAFILQMLSVMLCGRIIGLLFPRDLVFYTTLQVLS